MRNLKRLMALTLVIAMIFAVLPFGTRSDEIIPDYPPIVEECLEYEEEAAEEAEEVECESELDLPEETEASEEEYVEPETEVISERVELEAVEEEQVVVAEENTFETTTWDEDYTAPAVGIVATMVVRTDAPALDANFAMTQGSQWRSPLINNGNWQTAAITVADFDVIRTDADPANRVIHVFTPFNGPDATTGINTYTNDSVLPNIKADVIIDVCPSITDSGDNFMATHAEEDKFTSFVEPDISNITSIGTNFMPNSLTARFNLVHYYRITTGTYRVG